MIVKRHFTPASMWPYVRLEISLAAASSTAAWLLADRAGWTQWTLPASVATVLGTSLSILLAVRANTSYQRWWEGSAIWAQIVGLSRNVVRVAVSVSNSKIDADPAMIRAFQRDIAHRQIAYAAALRAQLRGHAHADLATQRAHLDPGERDALLTADNPAMMLLAGQSARIFSAYRDGLFIGLDNFQMEAALSSLSTQQALAERISMQPVPRIYDVFSRYLVHVYSIVFPFAVIETLPEHRWLIIPATLIIAFAFRIVERIGSIVEAPFGNTIQDVPLTAITVLLERDLLQLAVTLTDPPHPNRRTAISGEHAAKAMIRAGYGSRGSPPCALSAELTPATRPTIRTVYFICTETSSQSGKGRLSAVDSLRQLEPDKRRCSLSPRGRHASRPAVSPMRPSR